MVTLVNFTIFSVLGMGPFKGLLLSEAFRLCIYFNKAFCYRSETALETELNQNTLTLETLSWTEQLSFQFIWGLSFIFFS